MKRKYLKIFKNVYLFLRERDTESVSGGGAEREGGTESETGYRLRAVSTEPDGSDPVLKPTNWETGPELKLDT